MKKIMLAIFASTVLISVESHAITIPGWFSRTENIDGTYNLYCTGQSWICGNLRYVPSIKIMEFDAYDGSSYWWPVSYDVPNATPESIENEEKTKLQTSGVRNAQPK